MLIEWMMDLGGFLLDVILGLLGVLPKFSPDVISTVDEIFNFMFGGVSLVGVFLDIRMVKILIPFVIGILNFDNIYKMVMWIIKKIPIVDIK